MNCSIPLHEDGLYEDLANRMLQKQIDADAVEARAPDGFSNIDDVLSFEQRKAVAVAVFSVP